MLWKFDHFDLPNNLPTAQRRFTQLQARMQKDPELAQKLQSTINDYIQKHYAVSTDKMKFELIDATCFSSFSKMTRVMAYVSRFVKNLSTPSNLHPYGHLTQPEYHTAEMYLYRQAQFEGYAQELVTMKRCQNSDQSNPSVPKSSTIYKDLPYIDADGVLRARGRIDRADVPAKLKRPIQLASKCRITELLILSYHKKYHHSYNEIAINEVRQRFPIPKLRPTLYSVIKTFNLCKIRKAVALSQQMGELPTTKCTTFSRPLTAVRIDYLGPIMVAVDRRTEKRWGMVVNCQTTKVVHIEVASSLSADSYENHPRNYWPKGRVMKTIVNKDGQTRRTTIQTMTGIYKRPTIKLAVLTFKNKEVTRQRMPSHREGVLLRLSGSNTSKTIVATSQTITVVFANFYFSFFWQKPF